jgi:3-hydroxybutyryl-CoA dehydrogenase
MKEPGSISIIGAEDVRTRIGRPFSKAGLAVTSGDGFREAMTNCDIVIECLPVNVDVRKDLWREWDKRIQPDAILAITTSAEVSEIAGVTTRPDKVIGLGFTYSPSAEDVTHVQIAKGLETSTETIKICRNVIEKAGVPLTVVQDSAGLALDRALACVINEAAVMYLNGVATVEDIDRIPKLCLNWPMGPFELADSIGLDNVLTTLETLAKHEGPRFTPCRLLREMVALNRLGKKTRKGFYVYE